MVIAAAGETHRAAIFLMLTLASAGTFLHTGLKLPYYMFFGKDPGRRRRRGKPGREPPGNMLVAMGLTAAACVVIGVFPGLLYERLPNPVDFVPYTLRHVTSTLGMLGFTALGFFLLLKHLDPVPTISLDTDWFYRRGSACLLSLVRGPLSRLESAFVGQIYEFVIRGPVLGVAQFLRKLDSLVVDSTIVGVGRSTQNLSQVLKTDGERQRPALRTHHGDWNSGAAGPGNIHPMIAYPVLTTTTFLPLVGAALILFGQRAARPLDRTGHDPGDSGGLGASLLAIRQGLERSAIRRVRGMDPVVPHRLRHGSGWDQSALHLPRLAPERPVHRRLVDCDPNESAGILRRPAGCRDGDDRSSLQPRIFFSSLSFGSSCSFPSFCSSASGEVRGGCTPRSSFSSSPCPEAS